MKLFYSLDCTQNPALFTPWSLIHGVTGILSYSSSPYMFCKSNGNNVNILFWMHALYECKDLYYSYIKNVNLNPSLPSDTVQNSLLNSMGDQFIFMVGVYISKKYKISLQDAVWIQILAFVLLASPMFQDTVIFQKKENKLEKQDKKGKWNLDIWYRRG